MQGMVVNALVDRVEQLLYIPEIDSPTKHRIKGPGQMQAQGAKSLVEADSTDPNALQRILGAGGIA